MKNIIINFIKLLKKYYYIIKNNIMSKFKEYFAGTFDSSVIDKILPENRPYIAYSAVNGLKYSKTDDSAPGEDGPDSGNTGDVYNYFYIESFENPNEIILDSTTWAGQKAEKLQFSIGESPLFYDYSENDLTWYNLTLDEDVIAAGYDNLDRISLNPGQRLYLRCIEGSICKEVPVTTYEESVEEYMGTINTPLFKTTDKCNIGGNLHTVMFKYDEPDNQDIVSLTPYCFAGLFTGGLDGINEETGEPVFETYNYIQDASKLLLPTEDLSYYGDCIGCYAWMFNDCQWLHTAPELPATVLTSVCYKSMFEDCISLIEIAHPKVDFKTLPATTLAPYCYQNMFKGCTSLVQAPEMPHIEIMPEWEGCFNSMFYGCESLNYIKCLIFNHSEEQTYEWVEGVDPNGYGGTFIKIDGAEWVEESSNGIPPLWSVDFVELA